MTFITKQNKRHKNFIYINKYVRRHKAGSTLMSKLSLYAIALRRPFIVNKGNQEEQRCPHTFGHVMYLIKTCVPICIL